MAMAITEPVVVSLHDLEAGRVALSSLEQAFGPSSLGIIIVKDLPQQYVKLRRDVLSYSSHLANLPPAELAKLENADAKYLTGWSLGKENLKPGVPDTLKGSYYINCAYYTDPSLDGAPTHDPRSGRDFSAFTEYIAPNTWPGDDVLPGFRAAAEELCRLIIDTAVLVARACDMYATKHIEDYEGQYLERMVKSSMTTKARLLHYFPPPEHLERGAEHDTMEESKHGQGTEDDWCATHVDHGCLTGLTSAAYVDELADDNRASLSRRGQHHHTSTLSPLAELAKPPDPDTGLYIRSREGTVTKVSIPRDCLAFQTGEALELITRGKFRAVPHFVRGATGSKGGKIARNTLAVFTQPRLWEVVDHERGLDFAGFAREVAERFG